RRLARRVQSGQLDPGVLLYFMQQEGKTAEEISDILYKQSGLLGLSGISNDMRELEESDSPAAKQAIAYFVFRIRRELGAMAAVLGGLDTIVFCGGIGENAKNIRAQILDGMEWFGVELNPEANERGADIISKGRVKVRVIQTDEELVIARAVNSLMGA
ncbi:MAG: acetate kinase, partial [Mangrovicoccus sp.]